MTTTPTPGPAGPPAPVPVRVALPAHLRTLAACDRETTLTAVPTQRGVLDALEALHPVLRGTLRDGSGVRRPFVRFFACEQDLSHDAPDLPLPPAVADGREPLRVVGAMAGG